ADAAVRQAAATAALKAAPYTADDLRTAAAQVQQAEAALAAAQAQHAEATLRAPADGVVAERLVAPGALVGPQTPALTLVWGDLVVALTVEEEHAADVAPGQTVTLTAAGLSGETFSGTVTAVQPAGDAASRTFVARVRPDAPPAGLLPGMSVQGAVALAVPAG